MIESGSCCAMLAEEIARNRPGATIVINSAFIAGYVRKIEGARMALLGATFKTTPRLWWGRCWPFAPASIPKGVSALVTDKNLPTAAEARLGEAGI